MPGKIPEMKAYSPNGENGWRPLVVYLAGPINGCSDSEAKDWRERVKGSFGSNEWVKWLDPMRRDYRGREMEPGIADEIRKGDLDDLAECDVVLAAVPKPSHGTTSEIFHAYYHLGKPVVIWCTDESPSPWLVHEKTRIEKTLDRCIRAVREYLS